MSFFLTYVSQHLMLLGLTLPFYSISQNRTTWSLLDTVGVAVSAAGAHHCLPLLHLWLQAAESSAAIFKVHFNAVLQAFR